MADQWAAAHGWETLFLHFFDFHLFVYLENEGEKFLDEEEKGKIEMNESAVDNFLNHVTD